MIDQIDASPPIKMIVFRQATLISSSRRLCSCSILWDAKVSPNSLSLYTYSQSLANSACIAVASSSVNKIFKRFHQIITECTQLTFVEHPIRQSCFRSWASVPTGAGAGAGALLALSGPVLSPLSLSRRLFALRPIPQKRCCAGRTNYQDPKFLIRKTTSNVTLA